MVNVAVQPFAFGATGSVLALAVAFALPRPGYLVNAMLFVVVVLLLAGTWVQHQ